MMYLMRRALIILFVLAAGAGGMIATAVPAQAEGKACPSLKFPVTAGSGTLTVKVKVTHGKLGCAAADTIIHDYFGGGIPVKVGGKEVIKYGAWACVVPVPFTAPVVCTKGAVKVTGTRVA
jgi:hypothetical protein